KLVHFGSFRFEEEPAHSDTFLKSLAESHFPIRDLSKRVAPISLSRLDRVRLFLGRHNYVVHQYQPDIGLALGIWIMRQMSPEDHLRSAGHPDGSLSGIQSARARRPLGFISVSTRLPSETNVSFAKVIHP